MNTLFIILSIFLLLNTFFVLKRTIEVNKLHALYDSLENEIIKQRLTPDKKLITFLKIIKTPIQLNHRLDIFQIFSSLNDLEKDEQFQERKKRFQDYTSTLPKEIHDIMSKINKKQDTVITLSIAKPLNFIFMLILLVFTVVGYVIYFFFKIFGVMYESLVKAPRQIKESYENESIIISYKQTAVY